MAGDGADIPEGAIYTAMDGSMNESMTNEELKEQDRYLPIANVARIMKKAIPEGGKISKEAKECCQECVSEFISFITSEASDRCSQEKRKTINGEDILYAMSILGFDNYVAPLKVYLQKYREMSKDRPGTGGAEVDNMSNSNPMFAVSAESIQGNVIYAQGQTAYIASLDTE